MLVSVLGIVLTSVGMAAFAHPQIQDELLDKLAGKWHITRAFSNRKAENSAIGEWVIDHHYMRISMKDDEKPPKYEAHVYITYETGSKRYEIYWLDVYAGSMPGSIGYGERKGDSIIFTWKDADGTMRNTFTWHPENQTWISKIEQTDAKGKWGTFCTDTYRKA